MNDNKPVKVNMVKPKTSEQQEMDRLNGVTKK